MKLCIYHSADYDGKFSQAVVQKFNDGVIFVGWDYGQALVEIPDKVTEIIVVDLSPECIKDMGDHVPKIIWIDHHKSAIEKYKDYPFKDKYLIDGVAACRLAYQYFSKPKREDIDWNNIDWSKSNRDIALEKGLIRPKKNDYVNRLVDEPPAIRLAGEYDVFDRRDPDAQLFQLGLKVCSLDLIQLLDDTQHHIPSIITDGALLQRYREAMDVEAMCTSHIIIFEGVKFLALNGHGNSITFKSKDAESNGHDALMLYRYNGNQWTVSMYHAEHNKGLDLSVIASNWGGGGHRGACGFLCNELPWTVYRGV